MSLRSEPLGAFAAAIANEGECPGRGAHVDDGAKFQQALVHGTQLFGVHVPVVDAGEAVAGAEEREGADGFEKMLVGDGSIVEVRTFAVPEQAAKWRKPQSGRTSCKSIEGDLEPLPEVPVPIVMAAAKRPLAQPRECVAVREHGSLFVRGVRRVKQVALLGGEEKEQAVDEPKELLEVALR